MIEKDLTECNKKSTDMDL